MNKIPKQEKTSNYTNITQKQNNSKKSLLPALLGNRKPCSCLTSCIILNFRAVSKLFCTADRYLGTTGQVTDEKDGPVQNRTYGHFMYAPTAETTWLNRAWLQNFTPIPPRPLQRWQRT